MDCKLAREIPKSFCSDDETIGLVQEIYCLNMFVIIRNEQGYFKDQQI